MILLLYSLPIHCVNHIYRQKESRCMSETRNVTVCNKCPRMSLIITLIPGCDLEHSQGTLTLGIGTELLCVKHLVIMFYLSVKFR